MTGIVEFLTSRLDEDEQRATRASHDSIGSAVYRDLGCRSDDVLFAAKVGSPARVLADVAARRAILDLHADHAAAYPDECAHCNRNESAWDTIRLLAQPYRDHPDFDPAWAEETR